MSNPWSAPWTADDRCQRHQAEQAEKDLAAWLSGTPHVAFDAFKKLLEPIAKELPTLLEVGCGCGYGRKVLHSFSPQTFYFGIDISPDMVKYASDHFSVRKGDSPFKVGFAETLPFKDGFISCVCLAAVLQHLPDWQIAIREAVRVSRKWVMLHRVEATTGATFVYNNCAYEAVLPTRIMNEVELIDFCVSCGLRVTDATEWGRGGTRYNASYLFVKETTK